MQIGTLTVKTTQKNAFAPKKSFFIKLNKLSQAKYYQYLALSILLFCKAMEYFEISKHYANLRGIV